MVKSSCNAEDWGSIPGLGKVPGEREWLPSLVSLLGEFIDRGACCNSRGVARVGHD